MKSALEINIICNDQTVLDWIKANIPAKLDNKVWAEEYTLSEGTIFMGVDKYISGHIPFNLQINRDNIRDAIKTKVQSSGVKVKILTGSYVNIHACNHDETGQVTACTSIPVWSK